jgi:fructokinase
MTVAAIEAGGTKIVCAIGSSVEEIRTTRMRCVIPTTDPAETVSRMASFFSDCRPVEKVDRVGIATFGPVDLRTGVIGPTPKPGWSGFSWRTFAESVFAGAKVVVDTDVNAAALAEARHGASRDLRISAYLTVGTGIGGGVIVNDCPFQGAGHPEIGHMFVPRLNGDTFPGVCPYHGDCLEGLASGRAIGARAGVPAEILVQSNEIWTFVAAYLGTAILNLMTVMSPQRIVLGGGVMKQPFLLDLVRREVAARCGGYFDLWFPRWEFESIVVAPDLGDDAGIVGALELARPTAALTLNVAFGGGAV